MSGPATQKQPQQPAQPAVSQQQMNNPAPAVTAGIPAAPGPTQKDEKKGEKTTYNHGNRDKQVPSIYNRYPSDRHVVRVFDCVPSWSVKTNRPVNRLID